MKKSARFGFSKYGLVIFAISLIFFAACEIGLGASVDTEAPKIEFADTTVEAGSVVRDNFAIHGSFNDDGSIGSITATLKNLSTGAEFVKEGTFDEKQKSWTVVYSPVSEAIPDGSYEFSVVIKDTADHETKVNRAITIDNTPPLVVLSRPSTKLGATLGNAPSYDSYGQKFTLEGKAADDNDVSLIEVNVYDNEACTGAPLKTIALPNVPLTIETDVAEYSSTTPNDYAVIYGHVDTSGIAQRNGGDSLRYCKLVVYDGAQRYPADGGAQTEADKKGNSVDYYYLNSDISDLFSAGYKITELYHILNGTYTGSARSTSPNSVISLLNSASTKVSIGQFKLNPENSPKFVVSARNPIESGTSFSSNAYDMTNGNNYLEIEVSPGLDGHLIRQETFGAYLVRCDNTGTSLLDAEGHTVTDEDDAKIIWLFKPGVANYDTYQTGIAIDEQAQITQSGSTYKFKTLKQIGTEFYSDMTTGENYLIRVVGKDSAPGSGNDIMSDGTYGFRLITSGLNIEVRTSKSTEWISSNSSANSANRNPVVTLDYALDNKPYNFYRSFEAEGTGIENTTAIETGKQTTPFEDTISATSIPSSAVDTSVVPNTVTVYYLVKGKDSSESNIKNETFKYDNNPPVVTIPDDDIPDTTATEQRSITFQGDATDYAPGSTTTELSGVKKVYVQFWNGWDDSETEPESSVPKTPAAGQTGAITASISDSKWICKITPDNYSSVFATEGEKTIKVTAEDGVGLTNTTVQKKMFIYDKSSPTISFTNITPAANTYRNNGFEIEVEAADTNDIEKVEILYGSTTDIAGQKASGKAVSIPSAPADWATVHSKYYTDAACTTKASATFVAGRTYYTKLFAKAYKVGSETGDGKLLADGTYEFTVRVTDKAGKTKDVTRSFTIDTVNPSGTWAASSPAGTITGSGESAKKWYKASSIRFAITVDDENIDTVEISKDGEAAEPMSLSNGNHVATLNDISSGQHTITVSMRDKAGNTGSASMVIYADQTAPTLTVADNLSYMPQNGFDISVTAADSGTSDTASGIATIIVKEEHSTYDTSTSSWSNWTVTTASGANGATSTAAASSTKHLPLGNANPSEGKYRYTVTLKDYAGNIATESFETIVDTTAPLLSISSPNGKTGTSAINSTPSMFGGSIIEANVISAIYYKIASIYPTASEAPTAPASNVMSESSWAGWTSVNPEAIWSFYKDINTGAADAIAEGKYKIYMYAVDGAGNVSTRVEKEFHVDMANPVVDITTAPAYVNYSTHANHGRTVNFGGTVTESQLDTFYIKRNDETGNGTLVNVGTDGSWTYSNTPTEDGTYTFTFTATDLVGKANASASLPLTRQVVVDTVLPVYTSNSLKVGSGNDALSDTAYYKDTTLKMRGQFTDATSGMDTLYYYVQYPGRTGSVPDELTAENADGEVSFASSLTDEYDFTFTAVDYKNNTYSNGTSTANTLYIQTVDKVNNKSARYNFTVNVDTSAPELETKFYQVGNAEPIAAGGTVYVKTGATITIYGNYKDEESGVQNLSNFKVGTTDITPTITYSTSEITSIYDITGREANLSQGITAVTAISFDTAITSTNNKAIRSWRAVFTSTDDTSGLFTLTGTNGANNPKNISPFSITMDNTPPNLKNIRLLVDPDNDIDAYKKTVSGTERYYINNTNTATTPLTISGLATDNINVASVTIEIPGTTSTNTGTASEWKFENINLSGVANTAGDSPDATATVTVTDVAGNTNSATLNIYFDTTGPVGKHEVDASSKDLYFRMGNADNDDINSSSTNPLWSDSLDKEVGKKYSDGTYGNAATIKIRGNIGDADSGVKMIYYCVFDRPIVLGASYTDMQEVTVAPVPSYGFASNDKLRDYVIDHATGYFAPSSSTETKRVFYNVDGTDPYNGEALTGTSKYYKNVETNYDSTISGFTNENNYLVIAAVDNVGNKGLDTATVTSGSEPGVKNYCKINLDSTPPDITLASGEESIHYANGKSEVVLHGFIDDPLAGVNTKSVSFKVSAQNIAARSITTLIDETSQTAASDMAAATYGYFTLKTSGTVPNGTETVTCSTQKAYWTLTIKPAALQNNSGNPLTGNLSVNCSAADQAGDGNSQILSIATIVMDSTGPIIEVNALSDADTTATGTQINGVIPISGNASDTNGLHATETMKLYYTTSNSLGTGTAATSNPILTGTGANVGNDASTKWKEIKTTQHGNSWTFSNINTESLEKTYTTNEVHKTDVYFIVTAIDKAGNIGYSNRIPATVDQDTDRPIITLTNIDLTESIFGNNELYGNVADDDGVPSTIRYYIGNTAPTSTTTWIAPDASTVTNPTFTYANGSFKLKLDDGAKKIWFKVNDGTNDFVSSNITSYTSETIASILRSIKLVDSQSHKFGYRPESGTDTDISKSVVETTIDTQAPFIDSLGWSYHVTTGTPTWQSINTKPTAGGTGSKKEINVRVYAYDVNGVNTVKLKFPKNSQDASTAAEDEDENYYIYNFTQAASSETDATKAVGTLTYNKWTSATINATGMVSGIRECKLEVYDGAKTTTETVSITIDNTPADFEFTNYTDNQTVYGIKDIEVQGTVTATDMAHVYYYLTDDSVTTAAAAKTIIDSHQKEIAFENSRLNSVIKFDGDTTATDATHEITLRSWLANLYNVTDIDNYDDTEILKLWVYVVDEMENSSDPKSLSLNVVPNGDKPVVSITYPGAGLKLGGTIRFSGETSIETSTVEKVYAQILVPEAAADASDWEEKLTEWLPEQYRTGSEQVYTVVDIDTNTRGIAVSGTPTSWNFAINSRGELERDVEADEEPPSFTLNFIAKSASGKLSDIASRTIQIDKNAPSIGVDIPLQLVKFNSLTATDIFADTNISTRVTYTEDMWISGEWYLIGDVKDSNGVKELTWKDGTGTTATTHTLVERNDTTNTGTIKTVTNVKVQQSTVHSTPVTGGTPIVAYDYKFAIKIGHTSGHGSINYTISAVDATAQNNRVDRTIKVNYDCTPPVFKATENSSDAADELSATGNKVQNSSGMYSVYGTFDEEGNQSGFERIAMYFTRTIGSTTNIVDPMVTKNRASGTNDKKNNYYTSTGFSYTSVASHGDGIYWKELTGGSTSNDTITISSIPAWVRVGGLCKVDGVIYKIKTVTTSALTVDGTLASGSGKTVYVSPALVIDNLSSESKKQGQTYNGLYQTSADTSVINSGDGDWLIEGVSQQSSSYPWTASLNSQNMLDGPVTIHFVAFDKAGNATEKSYSGNVANNAPRLAGVTVWTDYNGNGKGWRNSGDHAADYEDETKSRYYSRVHPIVNNIAMDRSNDVTSKLIASGNQNDAEGIAAESSTAFMKVTDTVKFIPEIVGGNGALNYEYKIGKKAAFTVNATTKEVTGFTESTTAGSKTLKSSAKAAITKDDGNAVSGTDVGQDVPTTSDVNSVTYVIGNTDGVITFDGQEILGALDNSTSAAPTWFDVIISDSTEGDTKLSCEMQVALQIHYHDVTSPVVKIRPFYWNSLTDNSVYTSKALEDVSSVADLEGHIELEGDLPALNTGVTGLDDRDPKVSGVIKIEGYAYDDIKLSKLYVQMLNQTNLAGSGTTGVEVAAYSNGSWNQTEYDSTTGWGFAADDVYCNSNGHLVKWTLTVNTANRNTVAAANQTVVVYADDARDTKTSNHDDGDQTSLTTYLWSAVKEQPNAASTYYTDFWCNTPVNNSTSDTTVVYKKADLDDMTYYYKMDIVPYITSIETDLSSLKRTNPSVYNRTALGHYPVRIGETITFNGYNLGSDTTLPITDSMRSSAYQFEVGGIPAINNLNDNNSKGNYTKIVNLTQKPAGDKTVYNNYYNRQPNGDNNNLLTDDVWLDIWQFNNRAAVPISGKIEQPVMKIRPTDGKIGFAFVNGPLFFSMGGSPSTEDYSYQYWTGSYDLWSSIGFTYDSFGNSYGVGAGGDSNASEGDAFILVSSKFGRGLKGQRGSYDGYHTLRLERIAQKDGGTTNIDKQRIKSPSIVTSPNGATQSNVYLAYYDGMNDEIRFKSGTTVTETSWVRKLQMLDGNGYTGGWIRRTEGGTTMANVTAGDLVYFCDENGNVGSDTTAYRLFGYWEETLNGTDYIAFQISNNNGDNAQTPFTRPLGKQSNNYINYSQGVKNNSKDISNDNVYIKIVKADKEFGQFMDSANTSNPNYDATYVSILASGATTYKTGGYLSLGVVPASVTGNNDRVVAVWLDQSNPALPVLRYAYNSDPVNNPGAWTYVSRVFPENSDYAYAGEYCKVAVDTEGGVHIAAYNQKNLDLIYAYLPANKKGEAASTSDFQSCVVDSNGVVGSNLNIDVGKNDEGKIVPYISYYATSIIRPKVAYYVGGFSSTDTIAAGAVDDLHTCKWECINVPTDSSVEMQSLQHNDINIGLWKDDGVIVDSSSNKYTIGTSSTYNNASSYNSNSYGQIYGNGTSNPVLGYAIKVDSKNGAIETAQMK